MEAFFSSSADQSTGRQHDTCDSSHVSCRYGVIQDHIECLKMNERFICDLFVWFLCNLFLSKLDGCSFPHLFWLHVSLSHTTFHTCWLLLYFCMFCFCVPVDVSVCDADMGRGAPLLPLCPPSCPSGWHMQTRSYDIKTATPMWIQLEISDLSKERKRVWNRVVEEKKNRLLICWKEEKRRWKEKEGNMEGKRKVQEKSETGRREGNSVLEVRKEGTVDRKGGRK